MYSTDSVRQSYAKTCDRNNECIVGKVTTSDKCLQRGHIYIQWMSPRAALLDAYFCMQSRFSGASVMPYDGVPASIVRGGGGG